MKDENFTDVPHLASKTEAVVELRKGLERQLEKTREGKLEFWIYHRKQNEIEKVTFQHFEWLLII